MGGLVRPLRLKVGRIYADGVWLCDFSQRLVVRARRLTLYFSHFVQRPRAMGL